VRVLDADRPGDTGDLASELVETTRGREIFFAVHGFNVNQNEGIAHLDFWLDKLQLGTAVPIGILWPGDCILPIFVDYVVEGHEAIHSGKELAQFLNDRLTGASAISFATHSLGARVVLQTISDLVASFRIRRSILMAGAIDDTCFTDEYRSAAHRIEEISILASRRDDVLAMAYPLGNPLQGIIDRGHPYWRASLGREGPAQPYPPAPQLQPDWLIPESLDYGHLDYIPAAAIAARYPLPVDIPPVTSPVPPVNTPALLLPPAKWKPGWSAGFASTRYQRP
jgi:Alpha/beta hydrolase of unknown function (DUF900)